MGQAASRGGDGGDGCVLLLVAASSSLLIPAIPRFVSFALARLPIPLSLVSSLYPMPAEPWQYKPSNITAGRAVK